MNNSIAVLLLILFFSLNTYADPQRNQHSYQSAIEPASFSFEHHAKAYADSVWAPDNEVAISAGLINQLLPSSTDNHSLRHTPDDVERTQYQALISDKSFGISASFSF